jgi:poly(hydroxyalkanoate) depolymerase family esterase
MKPDFKSAMLAAAQLTAAGNLSAATAAIQRALGSEVPTTTAPAPVAPPAGGSDVIDVETGDISDARGESPAAGPMDGVSGALRAVDWQGRAAAAARQASAFRDKFAAFRPAGAGGSGQQARQPDAVPTGMVAGSFAAPAGRRDYLLYLPQGAAGTANLSLVVMLHGCTQTPADFAAGTAMNAQADQHGLVVLYPAQSKTANQSACWNWFSPRDQRAGQGEPSIIAGMVREIIARYGIAEDRVYVAGLSAGGAMAAILADAYPELFAAVAVHSGLPSGAAHDLPSALSAMKRGALPDAPASGGSSAASARKPVRTIVFHGRQDRTVHPSNARQVVQAALNAFAPAALTSRQEAGRSPGGRSYTRTVHVDATGMPMVEQWEVQGAGHAWSGGNSAGSYTDPIGPDASAAIVSFFKAR